MSRRELIRMTDDEVAEYLLGRHTMTVATFGPDGRVHLVAMWYGFLGDRLGFATFSRSQKVKNLQRDPRITVLIDSGENYEQLRGVEMVGEAILHDDDETKSVLARSVAMRYFGLEEGPQLDMAMEGLINKRTAIEIAPEKIVSWDHSKLAGVY